MNVWQDQCYSLGCLIIQLVVAEAELGVSVVFEVVEILKNDWCSFALLTVVLEDILDEILVEWLVLLLLEQTQLGVKDEVEPGHL